MKRTFVAIPFLLSQDFIDFFEDIKRRVKGKINWVKPENMHFTLAFIGETTLEMELAVKKAIITTTTKMKSFNLLPEGLDVFPPKRKPRVLWTGLNDSSKLVNFRNELWENLQFEMGIMDDSKIFFPHLTLARIKWLDNLEILNVILKRYHKHPFPVMPVERVTFYESKLSVTGPVYHNLGSYLLQKGF